MTQRSAPAGHEPFGLSEQQRELFREPNFAVATTLRSDGTPHASVVWVDEEDGRPTFNTTNTRAKARHLRNDRRVTLLVWDRADPYRYLEVEGIAELNEERAADHINRLSHKYRGHDFPGPSDRVIVRVTPVRVFDYLDGPPPDPRPTSSFAVTIVNGPRWDSSRQRREQSAWHEHAAFMDSLVDEGFVVLGGPIGDGEEAMVVVETTDEHEIQARLGEDPWVKAGVLRIDAIRPWTIWLDGRQTARGPAREGGNTGGSRSA
jgi:PPOX class probable F420-dependent enzyme